VRSTITESNYVGLTNSTQSHVEYTEHSNNNNYYNNIDIHADKTQL